MEIQAVETSRKRPLSYKGEIHQLHFALSWYRISVAAEVWCRKPGSASASYNAPYILVTCYVKYYSSHLNCGPQGQSLLTSSSFFFFYSALGDACPHSNSFAMVKESTFPRTVISICYICCCCCHREVACLPLTGAFCTAQTEM